MKLQLSAIDTWFFRDSTPFDKEDSSQAGVVGMFPPYPTTVAGAIRAALARRNGWDGRSPWRSEELVRVLGDGPMSVGRLRITGPLVLYDGGPVFPVSRHVVGRDRGGGWMPEALLRPGPDAVASDLGAVGRLPIAPADPAPTTAAIDTSSALWVTLTGLQRILHGDLPGAADLVPERALWAGEARVGIERAAGTHTVVEGALYSTRHVRPDARVRLGVVVDGVPPDWSTIDDVIALGGESRLAACELWPARDGVSFDAPPRDAQTAVVIALTPVLFDTTAPGSGLSLPGARIVSACIDRPLRIGGWDSLARAPLPLRNAAAPGSVWFCQLDDPDAFHASITNGLVRAGAATAMGFGLCATGSAPHWETVR